MTYSVHSAPGEAIPPRIILIHSTSLVGVTSLLTQCSPHPNFPMGIILAVKISFESLIFRFLKYFLMALYVLDFIDFYQYCKRKKIRH
jgi:hypothetical protein